MEDDVPFGWHFQAGGRALTQHQETSPSGLGGKERAKVTQSRLGAILEAGAILVGITLGLLTLDHLYGGKQVDFEELALAATTVPERPKVDGFPVHCEGFLIDEDRTGDNPIENIDDCIAGSVHRHANRSVLWLGNSQVHAINQFEPGDVTAAGPIHQALAPVGLDFLTVSYPNANQQEHLVTYAYFKGRTPLRAVILDLVFDDFRESGIRARLDHALRDPMTQAVLNRSEFGARLVASVGDRLDVDTTAGSGSLQDRSEAFLTGWLSDRSRLWAQRPQARGSMFESLYRLRNAAFGINPQTVRRIVPGAYAANRAAVEDLLLDARSAGIQVLGYIAPLRSDVSPPYDPAEYRGFVLDMQELFAEHGGHLRNLQDLVPSEYWGKKDSTSIGEEAELDFMHFKAAGHRRVATALTEFVLESGVAP